MTDHDAPKETEALPCPFCGSPLFQSHGHSEHKPTCYFRIASYEDATLGEMNAAWNRRAHGWRTEVDQDLLAERDGYVKAFQTAHDESIAAIRARDKALADLVAVRAERDALRSRLLRDGEHHAALVAKLSDELLQMRTRLALAATPPTRSVP